MPLVSPQQLWITRDGRLKLVEPEILGLVAPDEDSWKRAQQVLVQAVGHALAPGGRATEGVPRIPLPLTVRDLLDRLGSGGFASPARARSALELGGSTPGSVGKRRALSVGIQAGIPAVAGGFILLWLVLALLFPALVDSETTTRACTERLVEFESPDCGRGPEWESDHRALQICVVDGIHRRGQFASRWSKPDNQERVSEVILQQMMIGQQKTSARRALEEHPAPTEDEVAWAREQLGSLIAKSESRTAEFLTMGWFKMIEVVSILAVCGLGLVGLVALLTVPILRGGLTFKLLGLAVVHRDGAPE